MPTTIDRKLVYRRVPLPDEENAYPLWLEAARLSVPPPKLNADEEGSCCAAGGCTSPWSAERPGLPEGEDGTRLLAWIEQNKQALELIDEGIERHKLQCPDIPSPEQFNYGMEHINGLRDLARARAMRVRYRLGLKDFDGAAQDAVRLLQVGDLTCNGEGIVIHYLTGQAFRSMGVWAMRTVMAAAAPVEALKTQLAAVEQSLAGEDGLAQATAVDFWKCSYPQIESIAESDQVDELVNSLVAVYWHQPHESLKEDGILDAEERAAWRKTCLVEALRGHPRPFDKEQALGVARDRLAETIARAVSPPSQIRPWAYVRRLCAQLKRLLPGSEFLWPFQLSPICTFDYLGESEQAQVAFQEFTKDWPYKWREMMRPVRRSQLLRLRRRFLRISNPVGKMLVENFGPSLNGTTMRIGLANREAAKAQLAIRIYHERKQELPSALSDLVTERIIRTLPQDPFCGRPLRYCPRRAIVWSVGRDGKNRSGHLPHEPHAPGHILRWNVAGTTSDGK